ncbi:MAG: MFS transporter, partial [Actinomycetota bacterium]
SLVLRAAADGLLGLWLAVAFFGVFGPLISASAPKLMASWFPDEAERRRGVGWYAMAPALGGAITVAVTNPVLLVWFDSWRTVLLFEASIAAAATLGWVAVWCRVDRPRAADRTGPAADAERGGWRQLLGSTELQLVFFVAFTLFFLNHALGNWLPTVLEEFSGLSPSEAGAWVGAGGLIAIVSSGTIPPFADPNRMHLLIAAVLTVAAGALALIVVAPSAAHGPLAMLTFVRGALVPLAAITVLTADRVSPTNAGLANGLWFSFAEIGGVTGPLTIGALADTSAGYRGALLAVLGVSLAGAAVALVSHRERGTRQGT